MRSYSSVDVIYSKMILSILGILKEHGLIDSFKEEESGVKRVITVTLKYNGKKPAITSLTRVSKPGLRKYVGYREIPNVLNGFGIAILSTPQGIVTGNDARKAKVGGELLCTIY